MDLFKNRERIAEIYGTFIAIGLILYFFIMKWIGLLHNIELRLLNLLILGAGVYMALKQHRATHGKLNYFRALSTGVATSAIGTSTFALFLFIYLKIDKDMMETLIKNEPMGPYLNAYIASFMVLLEGLTSGFLVTFLFVNYLNTDKATETDV